MLSVDKKLKTRSTWYKTRPNFINFWISWKLIVDTFKDFLYKFESPATENEIWYHFQVLLIRNPSTRLGRFCVTNWSSFGWTESKYHHLNFWLCKLRYVTNMRLRPSCNLDETYNAILFHFSQTIFEAWENGGLSPGYMQKYLQELSKRLIDIEAEHLAPPGWRAVWMRWESTPIFTFSQCDYSSESCVANWRKNVTLKKMYCAPIWRAKAQHSRHRLSWSCQWEVT